MSLTAPTIFRVYRRYLAKGTADPLWIKWLETQHQGGKEKVPNPNPSTRNRYQEVSFTTALRDEGFKNRALKEFEEWKSKSDKSDGNPPASKDNGKPKPLKKKLTPVEKLDGGDQVFSDIPREEVRKAVSALRSAAQEAKKARIASPHTSDWEKSYFSKMSEEDTFLHFGAHHVGKYFEDHFLKQERERWTHHDNISGWTGSSSGDEGYKLSAAVENLGFYGSLADNDDKDTYKNLKRVTKDDKQYNDWLKKVHTFQQEVFKELGVKEVTLYRGVNGQNIQGGGPFGLRVGDEVSIDTRAASSYSHDPRIAARFGTVLKYKVPVENIILSPLVTPKLASDASMDTNFGEAEFVVMDASSLQGEMTDLQHKIPKNSSEKSKKTSVRIPISKENEDWIRTLRRQDKKTSTRIVSRFLNR